MTSNIGSDLIQQDRTLGFAHKNLGDESKRDAYERMKTNVLDEIKRFFRPEFLNRIDDTIVFHALSREHMHEIIDLMLKNVASGLLEKGITLEVTDAGKDWMADKGYDPLFGARPLRRVIQDQVEDKLSDSLLEGLFKPGDTAIIDVVNGDIQVRCQSPITVTK